MYFVAKSCIHTVWPPENDQNVPYFSPLLLASTEFRKIPRKHRNSAATGKFRSSAQNSRCRGKLWSLSIRHICSILHLLPPFLWSMGSVPVGVTCMMNHLLPDRLVLCQRAEVIRTRPTPVLDIVQWLSCWSPSPSCLVSNKHSELLARICWLPYTVCHICCIDLGSCKVLIDQTSNMSWK